MKTQLLEDIGHSATSSLVPSGKVADSKPPQAVRDIAPARAAMPVRPRSASGVWRQKPAGEPIVIAAQQPDQQAPPEALRAVEPIVVMEALPVPAQQVDEEAILPAEPTLAVTKIESARHDPVFDFLISMPTAPVSDLPKGEPTWLKRSGKRYFLWGSCVLSGALLIQAGLWLYGQRKHQSAPTVVAAELQVEPQSGKTVKRRAIGAKEFTLGSDGEVRVAPAAPAAPALAPPILPRIAQVVPPLVMLEPEVATAAAKLKPPAVPQAEREKLRARPKPIRVVEKTPPAALPKHERKIEREQFVAASTLERARVARPPARQIVREPVQLAEKKPGSDAASAATLKACKEHGYQAAQCVKRACSVTKYGFVCRG